MSAPGDRRDRHAGVIVPTFSLRSARDWGVGELPDLAAMAAWLADAGQSSLHTLPLLERAPHERRECAGDARGEVGHQPASARRLRVECTMASA